MASNAAVAPGIVPLASMTHLSPHVYLYTPPDSASTPAGTSSPVTSKNHTSADPKMVLIASWMGAQDAHIAKYVARYQALYPASQILLVKCDMRHMIRSSTAAEPVSLLVPVIRAAFPSGGSTPSRPPATPSTPNEQSQPAPPPAGRPKLLIHVFSNGGSAMLNHLHAAYAASARPGGGEDALLPVHCTVFDSAPGRFAYSRTVAALTAGFASATTPLVVRLAAALLARLAAGWFWLARAVLRRPDGLAAVGRAHNDGARRAREARRAYLYSRRDRLVGWRDVEAHAEDARARGFAVVRMENFGESPHVAHARTDGERYWKAVRETWEGK